jgi:adenylylsulfate kinase
MTGASERFDLFIGRWQPFHRGHEYIVRKRLDEGKNVAIAVRDTPVSEGDPYPTALRIRMIEAVFSDEIAEGKVKAFPICDISSINIGRRVGYDVNTLEAPEEITEISGTAVRDILNGSGESVSGLLNPEVEKLIAGYDIQALKISSTVPSRPDGTSSPQA